MTEKQRQERERKRLEIAYKENGLNKKGLPTEKNPITEYEPPQMEKAEDKKISLNEIIEDIKEVKEGFEIERGITNWQKESPSRWCAMCQEIGLTVFGNGRKNLLKVNQTPDNVNNPPSKGAYDIDMLMGVYEFYFYLCSDADMPVKIYDFANFTGMRNQVIYEKGRNLTSSIRGFYQKIFNDNEQSLENIAIGGKRSTVGVLATLNHRHGWDKSQNVRQEDTTATIKAVELPRLGQNPQE